MSYPACPLCEHPNALPLVQGDATVHPLYEEWMPKAIDWVRCGHLSCEHVYVREFLSREQRKRLLDARVLPSQSGSIWADRTEAERARRLDSVTISRAIEMLDRVRGSRDAVTDLSWLDVGCGSGSTAATALEYGMKVLAVDARVSSFDELRGAGVGCLAVDVDEADLSESLSEVFDVVSLLDVLEHVQDPRKLLESLRRCVSYAGVLVLSTPAFASPMWKVLDLTGNPYWSEIEHLHLFSRQSLYKLLDEAGFRVLRYDASLRYLAGAEVIARVRR